MSKVDTWMPLHIGAYLADTMHLTAIEHGAYLLLLMHYWRTGPLPNKPAQIAAIARLSPAQWEDVGPTVMEFFAIGDDGMLHQKRADAELARAREISSKRADAARAKRGANDEQTGSKCTANAEQMHPHARVARPLPQQETKEGKEERASLRAADARGTRLPETWQPDGEDRMFAAAHRLDPTAVADEFRRYWCAKAGQGARKVNWHLTWQTWCSRAAKDARTRPRLGAGKLDWLDENRGPIIDAEAA